MYTFRTLFIRCPERCGLSALIYTSEGLFQNTKSHRMWSNCAWTLEVTVTSSPWVTDQKLLSRLSYKKLSPVCGQLSTLIPKARELPSHWRWPLHPRATLNDFDEDAIEMHQGRYSPPWTSSILLSSSMVCLYPSGTNTIPWCTNVVISVNPVSSCPPPRLPVETKTPANFPENEPWLHCFPVWSQSAWDKNREINAPQAKMTKIQTHLELSRHVTISSWNTEEVGVMGLERIGWGSRIFTCHSILGNMHFFQHFFWKRLLNSVLRDIEWLPVISWKYLAYW